MLAVVRQFSHRQEIYSIDEFFIDLSGFDRLDLRDYGQQIRQRVRWWVGIPTCIGIEHYFDGSGKDETVALADVGRDFAGEEVA